MFIIKVVVSGGAGEGGAGRNIGNTSQYKTVHYDTSAVQSGFGSVAGGEIIWAVSFKLKGLFFNEHFNLS